MLNLLRKSMTKLEARAVGYAFENAVVRKGLVLLDSVFMVDERARATVEKSQESLLECMEKSLCQSALWHARSLPPYSPCSPLSLSSPVPHSLHSGHPCPFR